MEKLSEREREIRRLAKSHLQIDRVASQLMERYDELALDKALERAYDLLREFREYLMRVKK